MRTIMNTRRTILLTGIVSILLVPLIAMQFTSEVNWTLSDFLVAGALLSVIALGIELIYSITTKKNYRILLLVIVLLLGLITWVELAVGLFGSPFAGN